MRILALLISLSFAPIASAQDGETHEIVTPRFHLVAEGEPADAEKLGRLLESAWPRLQAHFKSKPRLPSKAKLEVRFFTKRERWADAVRAAGDEPPADFGDHYSPATKTAYAVRQPTAAATRAALLRAVATQYHYLARTKNKAPVADWYAHGIAGYLSTHEWNGARLTLAAAPTITLADEPAQALAESRANGFSLGAVVAGEAAASRALSTCLVRFLATGDAGKPVRRFKDYARKLDAGVAPDKEFRRLVGRPEDVQPRFLEWLAGAQQPWAQVAPEWEVLAPGHLRGRAKGDSSCRLKVAAAEMTVTLVPPPKRRTGWLAGVLLHYENDEDYSVALLDRNSHLRIHRRIGRRWQPIEQGQGPPRGEDGNYHLMVLRKGEKVYLMCGQVAYGPWELPGTTVGLALRKAEVEFRDVAWKVAPAR